MSEIYVEPGYAYHIQVCTKSGWFRTSFRGFIEKVDGRYFTAFHNKRTEVIPVFGDHDFQVTLTTQRGN